MFLSVVMPAFKAQNTIVASVHSALAQTHKNFELVISSDDQFNYEELLRENAINDARLIFTDTGAIGTGSSNARNIGINKAKGRYIVVLDADDQFVRTKLELVAKALKFHPLVTTGLEVVSNKGEHLRQVGCAGKNRNLRAGAYKFTNLSMDSMVAHDREKIPVEYDVELPCLVDLGLMLSAFCHVDGSFHLALPLHRYFKQVQSISMGPEASQRYVRIKRLLLDRLRSGFYPLAGGTSAQSGLISFLELSLKAENQFDAAKRRKSDLLFEDHLESRLRDFTG